MIERVTQRPPGVADVDDLAALSRQVQWPFTRQDVRFLVEAGHGVVMHDASTDGVVAAGLWWPNGEHAATLGMVMVTPARQGTGLGGRVMQALLSAIGERAVLLYATPQGAPLYRRLGFEEVGVVRQQQGQLTRPAAGGVVVEPVCGLRPAGPGDLASIAALDAAARGADRTAIVSRLLAVGSGFVLERGGEVAGFAIRRRFGRGTVIGPIVAPDESGAIALFDAAACTGFVRVDCVARAQAFSAHLRGAGLAVAANVSMMIRGAWPASAANLHGYALASQSLG